MHPILAFEPDDLAIGIPFMIFLIPIIAILVRHQQKMAEIIHGGGLQQQTQAEMQALRAEVMQLRDMMHHQARVIEDLRGLPSSQPSPAVPDSPRQTLSNEPGLR